MSTMASLHQVFFPRCHTAPDMPLGLIYIQYNSGAGRQCGINAWQPLGNIFMYRRLADAKLLCCLTHSSIVFYDVIGDCYSSFFNVISQRETPCG